MTHLKKIVRAGIGDGMMEEEMKIIGMVEKQVQMEPVHIFNYDKKIRKIVGSSLEIMKNSNETHKRNNLTILSGILHKLLFDVYEEALRDDELWEVYFTSVVKEMSRPIAKIDKTEETDKKPISGEEVL